MTGVQLHAFQKKRSLFTHLQKRQWRGRPQLCEYDMLVRCALTTHQASIHAYINPATHRPDDAEIQVLDIWAIPLVILANLQLTPYCFRRGVREPIEQVRDPILSAGLACLRMQSILSGSALPTHQCISRAIATLAPKVHHTMGPLFYTAVSASMISFTPRRTSITQ